MSGTEFITRAQLRRELADQLRSEMGVGASDAPPRRRLAHPEDDLQAAIVESLRYSLRQGVLVHHSPNERRDVREAKRMKRAGVMPGWPDLTFLWSDCGLVPGGLVGYTPSVAFIEIKSKSGSLTPEQRAFRDFCLGGRFRWALVRSLEQAIETVREWGLTRETR